MVLSRHIASFRLIAEGYNLSDGRSPLRNGGRWQMGHTNRWENLSGEMLHVSFNICLTHLKHSRLACVLFAVKLPMFRKRKYFFIVTLRITSP